MEKTSFAEAPVSRPKRPSLRDIYLRRLQRLLRLRRQHEEELNTQGIRLLDYSLFAAYCDCRDIGLEQEAREVLRGGPAILQQT